jgi:hypothetical protein
VRHPFQFYGRHSIPDRADAVYRRIVKMKHDSSPTRSLSLWVAQSRHLVNDIVRKVVRIYLHTLGQHIDEELACSIEHD